MGTSKGYDAPTTPQWQQAKSTITNVARSGDYSHAQLGKAIGGFIQANGGAGSMARGGGAVGGRRSGQRVAQNLGAFAQRVRDVGLPQALREAGLDAPEDRSPSEVAAFLTDYLSGSAATIDDADARAAASRLLRELLDGLSPGEAREALAEALTAPGFGDMLNRFFAYLLFEQFCRVSYDRLAERIGPERADAFLGQIRNYIESRLREEGRSRDLSMVDWTRSGGSELANAIFAEVLTIFSRGGIDYED